MTDINCQLIGRYQFKNNAKFDVKRRQILASGSVGTPDRKVAAMDSDVRIKVTPCRIFILPIPTLNSYPPCSDHLDCHYQATAQPSQSSSQKIHKTLLSERRATPSVNKLGSIDSTQISLCGFHRQPNVPSAQQVNDPN